MLAEFSVKAPPTLVLSPRHRGLFRYRFPIIFSRLSHSTRRTGDIAQPTTNTTPSRFCDLTKLLHFQSHSGFRGGLKVATIVPLMKVCVRLPAR